MALDTSRRPKPRAWALIASRTSGPAGEVEVAVGDDREALQERAERLSTPRTAYRVEPARQGR